MISKELDHSASCCHVWFVPLTTELLIVNIFVAHMTNMTRNINNINSLKVRTKQDYTRFSASLIIACRT